MTDLDKLCQELEIPSHLVKEFSDNYDSETVEGMYKLLSSPFVHQSLKDVKEKKGKKLYDEFVEEMLEGLYAYHSLKYLPYLEEFGKSNAKLDSMVRTQNKRTRKSDELLNGLKAYIQPNLLDLRVKGLVCMVYGSCFFGDAHKDSDIDVVFYTKETHPNYQNTFNQLNSDGMKSIGVDRNINPNDTCSLEEIEKMLYTIIDGRTESISDYSLNGKKWNMLSTANSLLQLIYGKDQIEAGGSSEKLQKTRELLQNAATIDPILNFIMSYNVAVNLETRTERRYSE